MTKELIFSITKDDFEIEVFRAGGKGGQKQNKTSSGVRIRHIASGCTAESREERSQYQNKKIAFQRLVNSPEFRKWLRLEVSKRVGEMAEIELKVKNAMLPKNLKIEKFNSKEKRWELIQNDEID